MLIINVLAYVNCKQVNFDIQNMDNTQKFTYISYYYIEYQLVRLCKL